MPNYMIRATDDDGVITSLILTINVLATPEVTPLHNPVLRSNGVMYDTTYNFSGIPEFSQLAIFDHSISSNPDFVDTPIYDNSTTTQEATGGGGGSS